MMYSDTLRRTGTCAESGMSFAFYPISQGRGCGVIFPRLGIPKWQERKGNMPVLVTTGEDTDAQNGWKRGQHRGKGHPGKSVGYYSH